jgi:hypothetical protein
MLTFCAVKPCCFSAWLLAAATMSIPAYAANVCDAVYQSDIKYLQTPSHTYIVMTTDGKPEIMEGIFAGGAEYLKVNGQWQRSPIPQQKAIEDTQKKSKTHPDTCAVGGNQSKDGQASTFYKVHNTQKGTDTAVWIAQSSGLVAHETANLGGGGTMDTRIDYSNVQPPAGVK